MFSKSCEYAIRAAIYISAESSMEKMAGIDQICEHIDAPKHFTAKILQILTRNNVVSSKKGVNGGYYLNKTQKDRPLIEIVRATDGDVLFSGCGLGLKECSENEPCPLHDKFKAIRNSMKKMMEESTIESMAVKLKKGGVFLREE